MAGNLAIKAKLRVGKNSEGTTESHSQSCNLNLILNCDGLTTRTQRARVRRGVRRAEKELERDSHVSKTLFKVKKKGPVLTLSHFS